MSSSNLAILAYEHTDLGPLCLRRREPLSAPGTVVTEITLNHQFLMSSLNTASEEALARVALEMHPDSELDVLVGGLGLGYTAHAALRSSRVARVLAVELLQPVVDWLEADLLPLSPVLKADKRFHVETADAYARLLGSPSHLYDVILVDIDHAPQDRLGDADNTFYTVEGLRCVRRHLAPGGVLGVWSWAEDSTFARAMQEVFEAVRVEPVTYFNHFAEEKRTDWLFFGATSLPPSRGDGADAREEGSETEASAPSNAPACRSWWAGDSIHTDGSGRRRGRISRWWMLPQPADGRTPRP